MRFTTGIHDGWLIGDPHFGRDFRNGTPLHRRGEREAMQMAQFNQELCLGETMLVMVGDLFDKPFVPLQIIARVANQVIAAAQLRPNVKFVYLAGNHDRSRQLEIEGAWDLFELAVNWVPNIHVVNIPTMVDDIAFYPWEWGRPAADQIFEAPAHTAIGHWDLMSFGGDDSHLAPTQKLMEAHGSNVSLYSGHYHEEGIFKVGDISVSCTGSMQPYTHAEDPEGNLYVTLTVDEALARDDLHDKCVRILLQPGEEMPDIDCLNLTKKPVDAEQELIEVEVGIGAFNINSVLDDEFRENDVPEPVQGYIKERMGAFA